MMTFPCGRLCLLLLASCLATASPLCAQDLPAASVEHGAFAFADEAGRRLLVTADLPQAASYSTAICRGGVRVAVAFDRPQRRSEGSTGRQAPWNFDHVAGSVFRVIDGTVRPGETCFIATRAFLSSGDLVGVLAAAEPSACDDATMRELTAVRPRAVVHCWSLATLTNKDRVVLVEFARIGKDALASLVILGAPGPIAADFSAEYRGAGQELWRAGDGGELTPDGFEVLFVLARGRFRAMVTSWSAEEGDSLGLFVAEGGNRFTQVLSDYWYRLPR